MKWQKSNANPLPFPSPTFVLAATTTVLTSTTTTCCTGRGHVGGKSPEFIPTLAEQRKVQTKWLKETLTRHSDRLRERYDVTGELRFCHVATMGPPSLNSNRQACTRWSVATLPPKVNFAKLRFANALELPQVTDGSPACR
ncbi:hypothetical protein E2C01_028027 [Portunus trituberculatus]|uniref:Uncharacterized protein n=1 Tax=Portunus trituberculatus TaxID=210409 RepID=A0A5B7EJL9_PORTR|nr:hypothetical protein [Portunus trituberculatus]